MDPRRRSQIVGLTLVGLPLGAIGIASLLPGNQEMRRNLYTDRASCERDYTREQCEPNTAASSTSSSGSGSHSSGFRGPLYFASRAAAGASSDPGPGRTGQVTRTQTSMRSGFGSIGSALGASS